ncbi:aminopeptidase N [Roseibium sediminis]|uniref:aminopeptidase N n=1 Tax=Roseibium sediminis TaxID=1775174 RepID=UPI00123E3AF8|nr:aminopeptidase N [Roseibium sediminis]
MRPEAPVTIRLEDYKPAPYKVETVYLDFRLMPTATTVDARMIFQRADGTPIGTPLVLDGDELELTGLSLDGLPLQPDDISVAPDRLEIRTPPADRFELKIQTKIDPSANSKLEGLYRSSGTYCTQCEAEGFRRITYFPDRPDVLAVYTTRIEARKSEAPVLLGNGNPVESGDIAGTDRHFAVWHDPHPKPSYLFALVAGDLAKVSDRFVTTSGKDVALNIYVEHGRESLCDWAMDSLKRSMKWDEDTFGLEYDLDVFNIVAVSDFNMGAMENKGLNIFNDKYVLADPETATDQDYANIEAVIAHEYFHNWTGNRITCRDWFQLCLKEGLTVFRDQEFSSDMRSRTVKRISDVKLLKAHQFPEDAGPLAHPVRPREYKEINNFYTATVYEKGAELIRVLKTLLGNEAFARGLELYFSRHDGDATTIEAFIACFEEASGRDLALFARWYDQAGTPLVAVESHYDKDAATLTLKLAQSYPAIKGQRKAKPVVIPLQFGLLDSKGQDMTPSQVDGATVEGDVLLLEKAEQTVRLSGLNEAPVLSILRGFSSPVRLDFDQSASDLLFLARHDSDQFNRWQALQTLATRELIRLTKAARTRARLKPDAALVDVIAEVLDQASADPAFCAQALTLPSEQDIARELGQDVDPDAIHKARKCLTAAIANAHMAQFGNLMNQTASGAFSPDATSAGKRALANRALAFYAQSDAADAADRVAAAYHSADNMTDRIAALTQLVNQDLPGAEKALAAYRQRHSTSSLAMDKWFHVQATAPHDTCLDQIDALMLDPLYDGTNPNRIRALVHAFAAGNPTQFARKDGRGFEFVADIILKVDPRNPQVASRLLTSFRSWRSLEECRAIEAKKALLRISDMANLSRDCREIVDKTLK